ncbi:PIN domain-containing protein [Nostoc sp. CHAB 5715]|uniref:type II toxin-antitoxin system VapC family toxin n=1 Tax=Nostoc sp. CHAB 5715 TaxID=2780400 RepID=UPI001E323172|nr:PIN domain-containing protein [Nostoc sp. CHAB 5715]MCC5621970.1 PIN domain nuclease [Nostoc sp. CHAB 5715]
MAFLIDTNIILRLAQLEHPMRSDSLNALTILKMQAKDYYLTPQNLIEYWRTCTRPTDRNGLGMTVADADAALTDLEDVFTILPDIPDIYEQWRRLVVNYGVMGVNVHDARKISSGNVSTWTNAYSYI